MLSNSLSYAVETGIFTNCTLGFYISLLDGENLPCPEDGRALEVVQAVAGLLSVSEEPELDFVFDARIWMYRTCIFNMLQTFGHPTRRLFRLPLS